jgi:hypothetical protein
VGKFGILGQDGTGGNTGGSAGPGEGDPEYPLPRAHGQGFRGQSGRFFQEKVTAAAQEQKGRKQDSRNMALIHLFPLYSHRKHVF